MKRRRERIVGAREEAVRSREMRVGMREATAETREASLREREELSRVREEAAQAQIERDRVMAQMREANQHLVLATVRAQELAEEAQAARSAMAASEERFRSLVMTSAAIVFRADARGQISVDPSRWRELTGLEVGENGGQAEESWLAAVHPDDREGVRAAWRRAVASSRIFTHQHRLLRRDGSHAWVVSRAVPIPRGGPVREWLGMMTDVSDRIRIEEAREQFIAILGHDLRNPLNAILMSAEVLGHGELPAQHAESVARITRSARRIEAMIRDVLDFARGRLGRGIPIERKTCDLGQISAGAVMEIRQGNPGRTITLQATGDLRGEWDADRLEQALSNLLGNAIVHGRDPIEVAAQPTSEDVRVSVRNQGTPIPPAEIPKLLEPFRAGQTGRRQGLGLGLYIVSEIVRAHGGTIAIESKESEGTTVTIRLPRRTPPTAQTSTLGAEMESQDDPLSPERASWSQP